MRSRYPSIEPSKSGFLSVSSKHSIYWEECGNPEGQPIVFLHGGPGSGTEPSHRCFFDPKTYRIILFDQRGCGKSLPFASLEDNTTWDLVNDVDKLREHLKIDRWIVFGGSWGSTLALAYSETHPLQVKGLILRGIFLCRQKELFWFYQCGASYLFPDEWEKYLTPIPKAEQKDLIQAYHHRLTSADASVRQAAALAWAGWEAATLGIKVNTTAVRNFTETNHAEAVARIECHYFVHHGFFKTDNWLIEHVDAIRKIPAVIVHGRYDVICPLENAWELHRAWPEAKLEIIPDAGHSGSEPGITDALIRATDEFRYQ